MVPIKYKLLNQHLCPLGIIFLRRSYLKQWYQLIIASTYCGKNAVPVFLGHPVYHIITLSLHWWTTEVLSIIVIKVITELSWNYCDLFNRDKLNLSSVLWSTQLLRRRECFMLFIQNLYCIVAFTVNEYHIHNDDRIDLSHCWTWIILSIATEEDNDIESID